jgi:hypothetical protein
MKTKVRIGTLIWLAAAIAAMMSGILAEAKPPTLQVVLASEVLLLIVFYSSASAFADFARSIPIPRLTLFHVWRVLPGAGFLLLYHRGLMPRDFAVPAGVGDIVVALLAPALAIVATRSDSSSVKAVLAFHIIGLLDLVMVVSNAARMSWADPASMHMLSQAPLVIVPIFFVPITIFLHIVAIGQCRRALRSATRAAKSSQ